MNNSNQHLCDKALNDSSCPSRLIPRDRKCKVCAKLPFQTRPGLASVLAMHSRERFDVDFALFDAISQNMKPEEDFKIDRKIADRTAEAVQRNIKFFKKQLQKNEPSTCELNNIRVVAPLAPSEVNVGNLLGVGGFSSVYEVTSFDLDKSLSSRFTTTEQALREYLSKHSVQTYRRYYHTKQKVAGHEYELTRYAIKRLRHELTQDSERFERAAIDLVLEGQLLHAMDHTHIVGIRGWNYIGADAFRSTIYSDYFLVLDRLTESLDERIEEWRGYLRKCRSRSAFPWLKQKSASKMLNLFRARIQVAKDVSSAIEYMHGRRIINRDIKSGNIGFDAHGVLKIFDFGLSRFLPDKMVDGGYEMSPVGTKLYMATEVRDQKPYGLSADVYSYGVVLWQILALSSPRDGLSTTSRTIIEEKKLKECWLPICPCWPDDLQALVRACLSSDPPERPLIGQVISILTENLEGVTSMEAQLRRKMSLDRCNTQGSTVYRVSVESKTSRLTHNEE